MVEGWFNSSQWSSARWRLDEQEPVDEQSQVEAGGGRRWMNSSPWMLEGATVEMNSILWSPILRYATPLSMNRTPISTVALQDKSVSSILRYARPCFHRLFCPSPPDEHDHAFRSDPSGWHAFRCLPMNMTHSVASP